MRKRRYSDRLDEIEEASLEALGRLADRTALERHGCLTVAQAAALMSIKHQGAPEAQEETLAAYLQLAFTDVACGDLQARNPVTFLPWTQYQKMAAAAGTLGPSFHAGWLIDLEEVRRWYSSHGIEVTFLAESAAQLAQLAAPDAASAAKAAARPWRDEELQELRALREAGKTDAEIGRIHNIARQRVAQLIGPRSKSVRRAAPPSPWPKGK